MPEAAKLAGIESAIIRNFMEGNDIEKRPVELWQDFVAANYDQTVQGLKARNLSFSSTPAAQPSTPPKASP